jgi:hypothetical protein
LPLCLSAPLSPFFVSLSLCLGLFFLFVAQIQGWISAVVSSSLFWFAILLAAGLLTLLYVQQDRMLYIPAVPGLPKFTRDNPTMLTSPVHFQIPFEDIMIPTSDGVRIHAWLLRAREPSLAPTLVFFHGNAGSTVSHCR